MIELKRDLYICCENCHKISMVNKNMVMISDSHYDHGEYGMGMERNYSISDRVECDYCRNKIDFSINVSEYPEGSFDSYNIQINGGHFIVEPEVEIYGEQCPWQNANLLSRLKGRQITSVYHFTRAENLLNILRLGIIPRSILEQEFINSLFNDEWRYDNCKNANCVSISFPNSKMFYKLRCDNLEADWVVIELDSKILANSDCAFCITNAGDSSEYTKTIASRKGIEAFDAMFCDNSGNDIRMKASIPLCYPTNPQAEVLVFDIIAPSYIKSINFDSYKTLAKYKSLLPNDMNIKVNHVLFGPRRDYNFWS